MAILIDSSVIARLDVLDPDRMRAARLADSDIRDRLFALYAFHAELAKVPELVTEPMVGQIRYQWWRECLDEIYGGGAVRAHEASTPLANMIAQTGISRFLLDRIIDGRERDLDPRPFENIDAAMDYANATSGALAVAAVSICGEDDEGHIAGQAWGLTGLARSYRYYTDSMLKEIGFKTLLSAASDAYGRATSHRAGKTLPAVAYVSLVPGFLKRMSKPNYQPTQDVPDYAPFQKQLKMMGAAMRGRL